MAKKEYYNIDNLLATKANYMMLLGQRANGKSYQVKKTMLTDAYKNKYKFVYLRRWKADLKTKAVEAYFDDMPIQKITDKEWDSVVAWNGSIYFARTNEKGELEKSEPIGVYCALNESERYKSWAFPNYKYIDYEEFITDQVYLNDEPRKLQQFISTVARDRNITVFLVGNTLSRVCPYFAEWSLDGVLKQKIGTIEIYHFHTETGTVDIAVEYCANTKHTNTMFFGQASKQIVSGEWDTVDLPKLPKPKEFYEKVYEVLIEYQKFRFVIELLIEPAEGGVICFVYPCTKKKVNIQRIITETFSDSPFITNCLLLDRKPEKMIHDCLRTNKVTYSDNLTGTDFGHVVDALKL